MTLPTLNAETVRLLHHSPKGSSHILIAIKTLTECWNGVYDTAQFLTQLRGTANRLNTLADAIEKPAITTRNQRGTGRRLSRRPRPNPDAF